MIFIVKVKFLTNYICDNGITKLLRNFARQKIIYGSTLPRSTGFHPILRQSKVRCLLKVHKFQVKYKSKNFGKSIALPYSTFTFCMNMIHASSMNFFSICQFIKTCLVPLQICIQSSGHLISAQISLNTCISHFERHEFQCGICSVPSKTMQMR